MNPALPFPLLPPAGGRVDLLIVAAEHSGDEHAARMVREAFALQPDLAVSALGGPKLAKAGAQLLLDLTLSSAIGPWEALRKLSYYRALIAEIVRWVGVYRPCAVCFVDSSGLNLRIAAALRARGFSAKAGGPTRTLYFISPQIWASRAGRRFKMAQNLDALAAIFPFEPPVYADTGLPVEFVGHPFAAPDYAPPVRFDPAGPILLLPGSRRQAVARIFPGMLTGFREFARGQPAARAVALYPSDGIRVALEEELARFRAGFSGEGGGIVLQPTGAPVAARAALTSSGTMSLHCALAGIPGAVTYRADPLFYLLARLFVRVKWIGIANILLSEPMYPEYIQGAATPGAFAAELRACTGDPARIARTQEQAARLRASLAVPAGRTAGEWLVRQLEPVAAVGAKA
jgi:lipid-A-disaccharide synthase